MKRPKVSLASVAHLIPTSSQPSRNNPHPAFGIRRVTNEEKCTLFVENLALGVRPADLMPLLSSYGLIEDLRIVDQKSYGVLRYRTKEAAAMARELAHDTLVCGRPLHLSWYHPRERGAIDPHLPATTSPADLDRYAALGSVHAPDNFAELMKQYKPALIKDKENQAVAARAPVTQLPYTTLRDETLKAIADKAASAPPAPGPLPPQPVNDMPPRDLIPYSIMEY